MTDDILQPLPIGKITDYIQVCANRLPYALRGHHFLVAQERWSKFLSSSENKGLVDTISPRCKYHIYVPKSGAIENCTFIALTEEAIDSDVCVTYINWIHIFFVRGNPCVVRSILMSSLDFVY